MCAVGKLRRFSPGQIGRDLTACDGDHEDVIDRIAAAIEQARAEATGKAAQAVRYLLKHQNFPRESDWTDYEQGFKIACELAEQSILERAGKP